MALYREPSDGVGLEDVAERDPPNVLARIYPELVVFKVQDVSFGLVVDDHRAVVCGPDDDIHVAAIMFDARVPKGSGPGPLRAGCGYSRSSHQGTQPCDWMNGHKHR